jgi:hypothetical protein
MGLACGWNGWDWDLVWGWDRVGLGLGLGLVIKIQNFFDLKKNYFYKVLYFSYFYA